MESTGYPIPTLLQTGLNIVVFFYPLMLYAVWACLGVTSAMTFYDPAFTAIAVWFKRDRARAILTVTLVAGRLRRRNESRCFSYEVNGLAGK